MIEPPSLQSRVQDVIERVQKEQIRLAEESIKRCWTQGHKGQGVSPIKEDTPAKILYDLVNLRNFTYESEKDSPNTTAFAKKLEKGCILMYAAKAEHYECFFETDCKKWIQGEAPKTPTIGLVRNEMKMFFVDLTDEECTELQIEGNTFVYRVGMIVILSVSQRMILKIIFKTTEEAARFEKEIHLLSKFHTGTILRLVGRNATEQLLYKCPDPITMLENGYYKAARTIITTAQSFRKFLNYAMTIEKQLSKACAALPIPNDWLSVVDFLVYDIRTIFYIVAFFEPFSDEVSVECLKSRSSMMRIQSLLYSYISNQHCTKSFNDYFQDVMILVDNVSRTMDDSICIIEGSGGPTGVIVPGAKLATAGSIGVQQKTPPTPVYDIIAAMMSYLENDSSVEYPKVFDTLSDELILGTESRIDIISANMEKEISSTTKKIVEGFKLVKSLQPQDFEIMTQTCHENIKMFKYLTEFVKKSIGFNHESWKKLQAKREEILLKRKEGPNISKCAPIYPPQWKKFTGDEFTEIKTLGKGGYGTAALCNHPKYRRVVLKDYHTADEAAVEKEIDIMIKLQHNENIVKLYGFFYTFKADFCGSPIGIVMEHIERSLHQIIHEKLDFPFRPSYVPNRHSYDLKTALQYLKGVAFACEAMHELDIIHRDIDPQNILVDVSGIVKVCDFGESIHNNATNKTGGHGKYPYMSPEMDGTTYDMKTDVFSLAITAWELIHRKIPYAGKGSYEVWNFIREGKRLPFCNNSCARKLQDTISKAWLQDPAARLSMKELKESFAQLLNELPAKELQKEVELQTEI